MNRFRAIWKKKSATCSAHTLPCDVAVIIPCHNYAHVLSRAIECVLAQTKTPRDILVVDDASNDHPEFVTERYSNRGVRYVRTEHRSLAKTRNLGAKMTQSEFLLFLDPDDTIPADYIERCLTVLQDRSVAAAYPNIQYSGERTDYAEAPGFDAEGLLRSNYIPSTALIRRQAYDLVGGYRDVPHALEDWDFYRRVVGMGYRAAKADTTMGYTIHAASLVHKHNAHPSRSYARDAALEHCDVTIFTPFAGRREIFERYCDALRSLDWNRGNIRLHWYNTSDDGEFDLLLRSAITRMPFAEVRYTKAPLPDAWLHTPESLIRKRIKDLDDAEYYYQLAVVRAYKHMIQTCSTEYVLTLEDDIAIRPDTLKRLTEGLDWNVAAVIAPYRSGFFPRYEVWTPNADGTVTNFREKGTGMQEVGGCGFGCTLFRMSDLQNIAPLFTGVKSRPMQWYDQISYTRLKAYGKILCNWDAEVEHMATERFTEGLATTFT
ncbi:glycosyltransferase family 2 protein [Candidatus Peregrinibacteria bacterium]|nr:glycosyltransferase family 2 protein [Candidatus Peregrinibacteria bacterium]